MPSNLPMYNLLRQKISNQGTFGVLKIGTSIFFTGELPWDDNKVGLSCIPLGIYVCSFRFSPSHGHNVYHVDGVPNRSDVEIHSGNFCGSVEDGYKSDVLGCLILGNKMTTPDHLLEGQMAVLDSKAAVAHFESILNGASFMLSIQETYPA